MRLKKYYSSREVAGLTGLTAGLAGLSHAVVDAARATVYFATFAALWGALIYYFVALPG